jgi:hypothetical protein
VLLRLKVYKLEERGFIKKKEKIAITKELEQLKRAASFYTSKPINYTTNSALNLEL